MSNQFQVTETAKINKAHELHLSKIESNRRTLKNLVAKRLRLDIEIQNLTRALRKQISTKTTSKRLLKESGIEMDSSDVVEQRLNEDPEWQQSVKLTEDALANAKDLLRLSDEQFLLN